MKPHMGPVLLIIALVVGFPSTAIAMLDARSAPLPSITDWSGRPVYRVRPGEQLVVQEPRARARAVGPQRAPVAWARPCCLLRVHPGARWSLESKRLVGNTTSGNLPPRVYLDGRPTVSGGDVRSLWLLVPLDIPADGGRRRLSFECGRSIGDVWIIGLRDDGSPSLVPPVSRV